MDFKHTSFSKKIVILGGGTGGLVAVNRLRKALQKDADIVILTVIKITFSIHRYSGSW